MAPPSAMPLAVLLLLAGTALSAVADPQDCMDACCAAWRPGAKLATYPHPGRPAWVPDCRTVDGRALTSDPKAKLCADKCLGIVAETPAPSASPSAGPTPTAAPSANPTAAPSANPATPAPTSPCASLAAQTKKRCEKTAKKFKVKCFFVDGACTNVPPPCDQLTGKSQCRKRKDCQLCTSNGAKSSTCVDAAEKCPTSPPAHSPSPAPLGEGGCAAVRTKKKCKSPEVRVLGCKWKNNKCMKSGQNAGTQNAPPTPAPATCESEKKRAFDDGVASVSCTSESDIAFKNGVASVSCESASEIAFDKGVASVSCEAAVIGAVRGHAAAVDAAVEAARLEAERDIEARIEAARQEGYKKGVASMTLAPSANPTPRPTSAPTDPTAKPTRQPSKSPTPPPTHHVVVPGKWSPKIYDWCRTGGTACNYASHDKGYFIAIRTAMLQNSYVTTASDGGRLTKMMKDAGDYINSISSETKAFGFHLERYSVNFGKSWVGTLYINAAALAKIKEWTKGAKTWQATHLNEFGNVYDYQNNFHPNLWFLIRSFDPNFYRRGECSNIAGTAASPGYFDTYGEAEQCYKSLDVQ